jgi:hypothetical protein
MVTYLVTRVPSAGAVAATPTPKVYEATGDRLLAVFTARTYSVCHPSWGAVAPDRAIAPAALSLPTLTTVGDDIDASSSAHWYARTAGPLTPLTLADTDPVAPEAAHPLAVNVLDPNDGAGGAGGGVDWK